MFYGVGNSDKKNRTYVAWTDDGAVPIGHEDIIAILEAVRARSIADALLAFFELLEQAEVAWNCLGDLVEMVEGRGKRSV